MGRLKSWLMEIQEDSQILSKENFIKKHGTANLPTHYFQENPFPFYTTPADLDSEKNDFSGHDLSDLKAAFHELKKV